MLDKSHYATDERTISNQWHIYPEIRKKRCNVCCHFSSFSSICSADARLRKKNIFSIWHVLEIATGFWIVCHRLHAMYSSYIVQVAFWQLDIKRRWWWWWWWCLRCWADSTTYIRPISSGTELGEWYLRYSDHLWYFLRGQLLVITVVDVWIDAFTAPSTQQ